jgi:hypothetical protein
MTAGLFTSDYTFRLGQRSFTLTPPAKVLFFSYLAMFVAFIATGLLGAWKAPSAAAAIFPLVFGAIFYPLMIAYAVYLNNCLIVGECSVLAWILAGFGVATAVVYVFAMVAARVVRPAMKR